MDHFTFLISSLLEILYVSVGREGVEGTVVNPKTFLDSRLAKGTWVPNYEVGMADVMFEGGWVWTRSGELVVTHVCRAKSAPNGLRGIGRVEPGEMLNDTCYVSGYSRLVGAHGGVKQFREFEILIKEENEVYEWVEFDSVSGHIPHRAVIGGIGNSYEPILVCRKFFYSHHDSETGETKSKAVLGHFNPNDGKCFYEVEMGKTWPKWDVSVGSEKFQLLVLRGRGKDPCLEPRTLSSTE